MAGEHQSALFFSTDWHPQEEGGGRRWFWSRDVEAARLVMLGRPEAEPLLFECVVEHCLHPAQLDNLRVSIGDREMRPSPLRMSSPHGDRTLLRLLVDGAALPQGGSVEARLHVSPRLRPQDADPANEDSRVLGLAVSDAWIRPARLAASPEAVPERRPEPVYLRTEAGRHDLSVDWRDAARLETLKGVHRGGRCFVIGNGPSLTIEDLERLRGEITFAANKIYLAFDRTDWRPAYYTVVDLVTADQHHDVIAKLPLTKIFNRCVAGYFPNSRDIIWFDNAPETDGVWRPGFSCDLGRGSRPGFSVTFDQLQLACHMGFSEIYLVGVDFDYAQRGESLGTCEHGEVLQYAGERNYFLPEYRRPGEPWTRPRIEEMRAAYAEARRVCELNGVTVKNVSRRSRLDVFERADLDALLAAPPTLRQPPLVSVIIPAYNAAATISNAIASVLDQTGVHVQVVLADDASEDDTVALAVKALPDERLVVMASPERVQRGPCAMRRLALSRATGDFIAFLDADDAFLPGKLLAQVGFLQANPDCVLCHGDAEILDKLGTGGHLRGFFRLGDTPAKYFLQDFDDFLMQNRICNSSVMMRAEAVSYFRGYDLRFQFEDWLQWLILSSKGLFGYLPEKLVQYRYHADSFTAKTSRRDRLLAKMEMLSILLSAPAHAFPESLLQGALLETAACLAQTEAESFDKKR